MFSLNYAFSQAKDSVSVTLRVSMKGSGRKINADGIHIGGNFNSNFANYNPGASPRLTILAPNSDSIYGVTIRVARDGNQRDNNSLDSMKFKFVNGAAYGDGSNGSSEDERAVPAACSAPSGIGDRLLTIKGVPKDGLKVLPVYKFNSCDTVKQTPNGIDTVNVVFRVQMKGSGRKISADGIRIAGNFNSPTAASNYNPAAYPKMVLTGTVSDSIYTTTIRIPRDGANHDNNSPDTSKFKFVNGAAYGNGTTDPTEDERGLGGLACATGFGDRILSIKGYVNESTLVLPVYKFNTCTIAIATSVTELSTVSKLSIAPNPANENTVLSFSNTGNATHVLEIFNTTGKVVKTFAPTNAEQFNIETANFAKGLYFARLRNDKGESSTIKFITE